MPCLHNILKNENIHRNHKLSALHALGDLSLHSGDAFNTIYLQDTLSLLDVAAEMSCQPIGDEFANDVDTLEYIQELREEITTQYSTILISVSESNDERIKMNYG